MVNPSENLHGTVINFADIDKLPKRVKYLDKILRKKVNNILIKNKPILFMPNATYDDKPMQAEEYKKSKYTLVLFGIFEDGSNGTICINDIEPYFEIKIPDDTTNIEEFAESIFNDLNMDGEIDYAKYQRVLDLDKKLPEYGFKIEPTRYNLTKGKPLHIFQENISNYIRVYFHKLSHRKDAINYIRALGYSTAHDDLNSYYRVVSRDYLLPLASWINIEEYRQDTVNRYLKGDVIQTSINTISSYTGEIAKNLLKDNTMTMAFDIETYNSSNDGDIPMPQNMMHNMFMISLTFQMYHSNEQLLNVCLVDVPSAPHPDFLTIVCNNEENLILGFAKLYDKMRPQLVMGFNSDGYDWPWIIERAAKYKGLLTKVVELFDITIQDNRNDSKSLYYYKKNSIKIEATLNADGQNLQTPGFIPIDVMTIFRQLYPTSEQYSLNFFLSKNKLGGKEDMPYQEMFNIYCETKKLVVAGLPVTEEYLNKMALVAKYCVVDSSRCHDLTLIRNVLQDKREVANISYTSIYDAFYRANGMKVRNLVIARGNLRNLKISNIANNVVVEGKYPGAWVFPPVKGLAVSKLSINERISKAKEGYTEYKDWLDITETDITNFKTIINDIGPNIIDNDISSNIDKSLPKCFIDMLQEHTGRPITGLDYSSLYPSLMMAYNLSPEYMIIDKEHARKVVNMRNSDKTRKHSIYKIKFDFNGEIIRGWSVRHDNHLDPNKPDFKFGLFPTILKELFDTRKQLKSGVKGLAYYEHEKEKMMALSQEEFDKPETKELYEDICFSYNALDSKQRALKVYMNTFYGESGNKRSPLFMLQVAGGITGAGRDNIKKAYDFVKEKDCKVYYGDSVTADTPILIRYTMGPLSGMIDIRNISEVADSWTSYPQFKPTENYPIRIDKQQHVVNIGLETWTSKGWAPVKRFIRHKTINKIVNINTEMGCVSVTEDHSLLNNDSEMLSAKDAKIDHELFHGFPDKFSNIYISHINESDINMVPTYILNAKIDIKLQYWNTYWVKNYNIKNEIIVKGKVAAQRMYYLMRSIKFNNIAIFAHDMIDTYVLTIYNIKLSEKIRNINRISGNIDEYVYDIETEVGTFLAGVGSICVLNTDSLYLSTPEVHFEKIDIDYYTDKITKLSYWEKMVEITFENIKPLNKAVNEMLHNDNGTNFLKMAFEESLFPVAFLAKKKYFGIPHLSKPNFNANVPLFIRGLELKKRGVSDVLIEVCSSILNQAVSYTNKLTIMEIVKNKIIEFYNTDWTTPERFAAFIMTATYKPNKQNVKMHTFKRRMMEERGIEVMPGERVKYIIAKKYPYKFDLRGRKTTLSIGDTMEFADKALEENIPVNIDYYIDKTINGQLARFITYHEDFHVNIIDPDDIAEGKKAELTNLKLARAFIDNYCKGYYTKYTNQGTIHKNIFKMSAQVVKNKIIETCGNNESSNVVIKLLGFSVDPDDNLEKWIIEKVQSNIDKKPYNKDYGINYINNLTNNLILEKNHKTKSEYILELQNTYYSNKQQNILKTAELLYHERQQILETRFRQSSTMIKSIYHTNNNIIETLSTYIKSVIDIDNMHNGLSEIEQKEPMINNIDNYLQINNINQNEFDNKLNSLATINIQQKSEKLLLGISELKFIYYNLMSNYEYIFHIRSIVDCLKIYRDKRIGIIKPMTKINKEKMIAQLINESVAEILQQI